MIVEYRKMVIALLASFFLFSQITTILAVDVNQATITVTDAEKSLVEAYQNVYKAENAGSNIEQLINELNFASSNLTLAYAQLGEGNYASAMASALSCKQTADTVAAQAVKMYQSAAINSTITIVEYTLAWLVLTAVIAIVTVYTWRAVKKRYYRKIRDLKPEVAPAES